ncbi:MAG TPA: MerR family DNA-binding transcriptional regulator [Acidimicrobiia bacterium]|jgi:DNA-binding transcriptional MerR regulator|nr:MerR family DNA-binding transcriptional regulator [Acidimicrobiia bacterium]
MQIGEIAREVGIATSAIRFYEEKGLIPEPERSDAGYRVYDPSVIDRLVFIGAGQAVGLGLIQLGETLKIRDRGKAPCSHVTKLINTRIQDIDERMRDLRKVKKDLLSLAETAHRHRPGRRFHD